MNSPAGVAVVGAGFISYMHVLAIRDTPGTRLVAVASRSRALAEHRGRIFDAAPYTFDALDEMCGRPDVDIAIVASPVYLHAAHAQAAIRARKHVIVEKPFMLTVAEAEAVEAAARAAGVGVGYAENLVFTPVVSTARRLIAEGAVGTVSRVRGVFVHGGPQRNTWFWDPRLAGGGAHLDLGSHALEVARDLAGKPEIGAVASCRMTRRDGGGVDLTAECVLETANGVEISVASSWEEPNESCRFEVTGDRGVLRIAQQPAPQSLTLQWAGAGVEDVDFPGRFDLTVDAYLGSFGYSGQLAHFAECFRTGRTPAESAADGSAVLRILAAGYLAAARGQRVDVRRDVPSDRAPIQLLDG